MKTIGNKLYIYDTVDSVMDIAHTKARAGEEEGAVIFAKAQKKGRGRLGRRWISTKGKGLYFAIILKPDIKHHDAPKVTLLSALSVAEVLKKSHRLNAHIRWPNDVLIKDKKACGILTESNTHKNKLHYLVVGIGLNINFKSTELPKEATSLARETKRKINQDKLLFKILEKFEENYRIFLKKDFARLIPKIEHLSSTFGKFVKIKTAKHIIKGYVQDIDKDGALILRSANGFVEKILTGDCIILR